MGCGFIGGMGDLHSESVISHAKALSLLGTFKLFFFDPLQEKAQILADRYNGQVLGADQLQRHEFAWVSIAASTEQHLWCLEQIFKTAGVILLEKPLALSNAQLDDLARLRHARSTPIWVNYTRRFLPHYHALKEFLDRNVNETPRLIEVRYCRGVLNNASHALDLIQFLFNSKLDFANPTQARTSVEFRVGDPTLSVDLVQPDGWILRLSGLPELDYPVFEVDMFYKSTCVRLQDSGAEIRVTGDGYPPKNEIAFSDCLKDSMKEVVAYIHQHSDRQTGPDNFETSLDLTRSLIDLVAHGAAGN